MTVIRSVVLGCGAYLPEKVLTNAELAAKVDTSDDWIVQRTGIRERHIAAEGEYTSHLATKAAQAALDDAGIDVGYIGHHHAQGADVEHALEGQVFAAHLFDDAVDVLGTGLDVRVDALSGQSRQQAAPQIVQVLFALGSLFLQPLGHLVIGLRL